MLARLVLCGNEVQWALSFVYGELGDFTVCEELAERVQREPLSVCANFICRLEPKVREFVFESVLCHELFGAFYRKFLRMTFPTLPTRDSDTGRIVLVANDEYLPANDKDEFMQESLRKAMLNIGVRPEVLYQTMQSANSNYLHEFANTHGAGASSAQHVTKDGCVLPDQPATEKSTLGSADLQDLQDSLDSLKAGQMELVRLIEHNRRPAAATEPYIAAQLGEPLYSRLHEKTRRAIQLAEYLYNINQEPDGFALTAITMAQGYENELIVRIIGPFVIELLAAGTATYNAQGKATKPLILGVLSARVHDLRGRRLISSSVA
jgi:hypothetical protein